MSNQKLKTAVMPVAGLGSRFLPITKSIPKEMLPIIDKPLIQFAIEEAIEAGIEKIVFVTSHTKKAIEDYFKINSELERRLIQSNKEDLVEKIHPRYLDKVEFSYVFQEEPKGLGHAILQAKDYVDDEFFGVILADDLLVYKIGCLSQLSNIHHENNSSVLGVFTADPEKISNYGVIEGALDRNSYKVKNIVEKPKAEEAPSNLAVFGRYILSKKIFNHLENTNPGVNGEIQLTDAIKSLIKKDAVRAFEIMGKRFDCGSKEGYISAIIDRSLSIEKYKDVLKNID